MRAPGASGSLVTKRSGIGTSSTCVPLEQQSFVSSGSSTAFGSKVSASAWQRRQRRIRREAEYCRRAEFLPRLQLGRREVRLVGAVGEMLRLEREPLGLAIGRAG